MLSNLRNKPINKYLQNTLAGDTQHYTQSHFNILQTGFIGITIAHNIHIFIKLLEVTLEPKA